MALQYPLVNGKTYGYADVEIDIGGELFTAVSEITYSHTRDIGILRGTRPEKLGRTRGDYDAEASLVFSDLAAADQFRQSLGDGWMEAEFNVTVSYQAKGQALITDKLFGCTIVNEEDSHSQGPDALGESIDLDVMRLEKNGLVPLLGMLR